MQCIRFSVALVAQPWRTVVQKKTLPHFLVMSEPVRLLLSLGLSHLPRPVSLFLSLHACIGSLSA